MIRRIEEETKPNLVAFGLTLAVLVLAFVGVNRLVSYQEKKRFKRK